MITATTFSGNLTGAAGTFSSLNVTGNVSIGGTLTYDDVINVDSIGVITARSGIILGPTSNDLRLGTGATISSPASNRLSFLTSGEEQVRINDEVELELVHSLSNHTGHFGCYFTNDPDEGSGSKSVGTNKIKHQQSIYHCLWSQSCYS